MIDRLLAVRRILTDAAADAVPDRLAEGLAKEYGVVRTELYLVDYRLAALVPVFGSDDRTRPGDPAWRCFDHQSEVHADDVIFVPVTVRGERIGVLACAPAPDDDRTAAELAEIGVALAHELQSARAGTDRYQAIARTRRLTLAAEMQWELLPARSRTRPAFGLAGQLEPSYDVRGDSFDWADEDDRLSLAVLNGMGQGVSASLLTALATYALRNARRAGIPLADQAALADQAIFAEHRGASHVSALLLDLDLATGEVEAVDAGSPRLLLLRDGEVQAQTLSKEFPLGMFEETDYQVQRFRLEPGDRLMLVSDGVYDAVAATGRYGDAALARFVRRTGALVPLQAVRSLLGDLRAFVGDAELEDDAVAVCLDWYGPRN
ncbi:phosphatase [Paractinoplanes abujensis]|uniref:Serine phosphatase RsbU (Regulator of sigma subunit) n=1 Tax=Paractinoplanes abujensis TaxID=882441 RepID=A0A7W7CUG9_9ACTN|nr:PP2C family protein-serine/threonine phosphatase [Actinoplanes abujensis]MBB4694888.1 serine phosphatase RsbU (regulator of sigma subunit) [Actinoplanes abujensis]GID23617.1 phosphatase [Actinoplanes abujensis]